MKLTPKEVDQIRQLVADNRFDSLKPLVIDQLTLGAAIELCCAACDWETRGLVHAFKSFQNWISAKPELHQIWRTLLNGLPPRSNVAVFHAPAVEFVRVHRPDDLIGNMWPLFLMRFARSLQKHHFPAQLAQALAVAFGEMADNIIQHSGPTPETSALGIVGYHVADSWMTFAVGDIGRGILSSLTTAAQWGHLTNSKTALIAAVQDFATSRINRQYGNGFKQVHKALADLNGVLRFGSGDAVLTLLGQTEPRQAVTAFVAPRRGFQLSVTCSLAPQAGEKFF